MRWVLAPVWGSLRSAPNGSIAAFKVEEQNGKPVLTQAWVSRDMSSPQPPVIARWSGVRGPVGKGGDACHALRSWTPRLARSFTPAAILWIASRGADGKMTVAIGRVYWKTTDGTFYASSGCTWSTRYASRLQAGGRFYLAALVFSLLFPSRVGLHGRRDVRPARQPELIGCAGFVRRASRGCPAKPRFGERWSQGSSGA